MICLQKGLPEEKGDINSAMNTIRTTIESVLSTLKIRGNNFFTRDGQAVTEPLKKLCQASIKQYGKDVIDKLQRLYDSHISEKTSAFNNGNLAKSNRHEVIANTLNEVLHPNLENADRKETPMENSSALTNQSI